MANGGLHVPPGVQPQTQQIPVLPLKVDSLRSAADCAAPGEDPGITLQRAEVFFNWILLHPTDHTVQPPEGLLG